MHLISQGCWILEFLFAGVFWIARVAFLEMMNSIQSGLDGKYCGW